MSLELTPLDEASLSPAARKVASAAAPVQLKLMAARGLAPLPPHDLLSVLYQLAVTAALDSMNGPALRDAAQKTARELPDPVLTTALGAPLDSRVLDFMARALLHRSKVLEVLLRGAAVSDETLAWLAASGGESISEIIAQNETRLLRHPAIITALYLNPKTRMSTAQRAVELAIRNGVHVEGIPSFDDVKAAIESEGPVSADTDALFAGVVDATSSQQVHVAEGGDEEIAAAEAEAAHKIADDAVAAEQGDNLSEVARMPMAAKLRLATVGNAFARAILVRDTNKVIALAAVRNPGVNEHEAERFAANRSLHEEVVRFIAGQRNFTKRYSVKANLVNNPKCPLQLAMTFLSHLTPRDLRTVARSKGVPSALAKAAQGLLAKREGG